jgi:hypothetical protein
MTPVISNFFFGGGGHSLGIDYWNATHIYLIRTLVTRSYLLRSQNSVPDCA